MNEQLADEDEKVKVVPDSYEYKLFELESVKEVTKLILWISLIFIIGGYALNGISQTLTKYFGQYIMILIPVIMFMKNKKMNAKKILRINPVKMIDVFILIGIVVSMQPFVTFMLSIADMIFGNGMDLIFNFDMDTSMIGAIGTIFSLAITPAICEEILMRGIVLEGSRGLSIGKAVVFNGLIFGLFHMNFNQFSYTFFMGIILALVVLITDSILSSVIIHFLNNLWAVISIGNSNWKIIAFDNYIKENIFTLNGILISIGSVVLTIILIKLLMITNKEHKYIPDSNKQSDLILDWPFWILFIIFIISSLLLVLLTMFVSS